MKLTGTVSGDNASHVRELSHAVAKRYFGNNCFAIEITHATEVPRSDVRVVPRSNVRFKDPTCFEAEYEAWPEHEWEMPPFPGSVCKNCKAKLL